jgi:hypothetical protein
VTDRHGPWVLAANLAGIAAMCVALFLVLWLGWTSQADPHAPRRGPIATITPTLVAPR